MKPLDAFFLAGRLVSPLYSAIMKIRASMYEKKIFRVHQLPVPIISVGNLTMGGTGKTPTVRLLAELLVNKGFSPAIISRGYGGSARSAVNIVSDGKKIHLNPEEAGDEPFMLASTLKNIPVLTGKKRILPCMHAVEKLCCDILILDDGFQHMSVHRNVNIVLFNATTLAGNGRVFPGGELREPFEALNRADLFIITGVTDLNRAQVNEFGAHLRATHPQTTFFESRNEIAGIFDQNGHHIIKEDIAQKYFAFSGIAHPERFIYSLKQNGLKITGNMAFSDHATYKYNTLEALIEKAKQSSATALITTEKDIVKIREQSLNFPLHYLKINASIPASFIDLLNSKILNIPK